MEDVVEKVQQLSRPIDCCQNYPENVRHLQDVLALPHVVSNMTQHYVGRYISCLREVSEGSQSVVDHELGNAAETLKLREYRTILNTCAEEEGCSSCHAAKRWEDEEEDSQGTERPVPCAVTQVISKLLSTRYVNLNPTYFTQCVKLAQGIPWRSPLTFFPEPPSELRSIAVKYPQCLRASIERQHPVLSTGLQPVFKVPSAIDAIYYTDGDGGTLNCELIPGLREHITEAGLECLLKTEWIGGPFIDFRDSHHDAIELGHTYRVENLESHESSATIPFGYLALVEARRSLAMSKETLLVPRGRDHMGRGRRLLVEIFTKHESDDRAHGEDTAVRLVQAGLSYPTSGAPEHCGTAQCKAMESRAGVWELGAFMDDPEFKPWNLKHLPQLSGSGRYYCVDLEEGGQQLQAIVSSANTHLNEAHVFPAKSTIPGADRGLFLRPGSYTIPSGRRICSYQAKPDAAVDASQTNDYLFEVECRGHTYVYQAATFDGQNIGRFINQGGLKEGLMEMCVQSDVDMGQRAFRRRYVEDVFAQHCNVKYSRKGLELEVQAAKPITADQHLATELFGNYGLEYWVRYTARNFHKFDLDDFLAKSVLWCLLSRKSCWSAAERDVGVTFPDDVKAKFESMGCPYTTSSKRKR
jgi:hypothetical protein